MAFQKDFLWGVSGAAAQQDGAYLEDGKGLDIWNPPFTDGRIRNNGENTVACDHYHRWKEDLKLLNNFEAVILIPRINPIKSKLLPDYQIDWKFSDEKVALKEIENKEVKTFNIK